MFTTIILFTSYKTVTISINILLCQCIILPIIKSQLILYAVAQLVEALHNKPEGH
jgi:hypothetical protein